MNVVFFFEKCVFIKRSFAFSLIVQHRINVYLVHDISFKVHWEQTGTHKLPIYFLHNSPYAFCSHRDTLLHSHSSSFCSVPIPGRRPSPACKESAADSVTPCMPHCNLQGRKQATNMPTFTAFSSSMTGINHYVQFFWNYQLLQCFPTLLQRENPHFLFVSATLTRSVDKYNLRIPLQNQLY